MSEGVFFLGGLVVGYITELGGLAANLEDVAVNLGQPRRAGGCLRSGWLLGADLDVGSPTARAGMLSHHCSTGTLSTNTWGLTFWLFNICSHNHHINLSRIVIYFA